jgi:hypothetical protein
MSTEISTTTTPARGLSLATLDDAFRFAKMVSGSDFAPKDFKGKPESCLLAIQHGSEIGLSPMQSLQSIAVVNGRPAVYGDTALAVCIGSPVCEYVREHIEGDGDQALAVCEAKRRGYETPTIVRFSVADAKKAGLWGKSGPWTQYSRRMLQMRARGFCLRDTFPDVLRGLVTAEEAQDYPVVSQVETVKETVVPADPAPNPFDAAKFAIQRANSIELLNALRARVESRLKDKTFTPFQSDELFDEIHSKVEFLESQQEVTA